MALKGGSSLATVNVPVPFSPPPFSPPPSTRTRTRTTWSYNAANEQVAETDPNGAHASWAYDAAGQLASSTDQDGRVTTYSYDGDGRPTGQTWYNSTGTVTEVLTYSYDPAGNLLTAQAPAGSYTLSYNAANEVTQVQEPFGLTLTFGYDPAGNRTKVQDSTGGLTTVAYDADNRMSAVQYSEGSTSLAYDYAYDTRGDLASISRFKNSAGTSLVGTTAYSYDNAQRLTGIKETKTGGTVIGQYTYTYDNANRLTSEDVRGATTSYSYDNADQLTADGSTTYSYDAAGNRTNTGYSTGTGNELTTNGTYTYTYDAAGNVIQQTQGAAGATWKYTYNNANELVGASYRHPHRHGHPDGDLRLRRLREPDRNGGVERVDDHRDRIRSGWVGWSGHVGGRGRELQRLGDAERDGRGPGSTSVRPRV